MWAILVVAHFYILCVYTPFSWYWLLLDAFVFHTTFALIVIPYWYPIRFIRIENPYFLLQLLINTFIFLSIWFIVYYVFMSLAFMPVDCFSFIKSSFDFRLIIGVIFIAFFNLLYITLSYYDNYKNNLDTIDLMQTTDKEQQLIVLKSQLQPHFLFNSLNAIQALIQYDAQKSQEMIVLLSAYLRKTLDKSEKGLVSLKDELEHTNNYLDIEKIRFGSRLQTAWDIDENAKLALLPDMLLQPLFENAIKHGLSTVIGDFKISISCKIENQQLLIYISNPKENATSYIDGVGLQNLKRRLAIYYGKKDLVLIKSELQVFEIQLKIPQL